MGGFDRGAKMSGFGKGSSGNVIDADAVEFGCDDLRQGRFQHQPLRRFTDDLEHRFLNSGAVAFTYFGNSAQSTLALPCSGIYVVSTAVEF